MSCPGDSVGWERRQEIQYLGEDIIDSILELSVSTLLYGISIGIFSSAFLSMFSVGLDSRPRQIIFFTCFSSMILATLTWISTSSLLFIQIYKDLNLSCLSVFVSFKSSIMNLYTVLAILLDWTLLILPVIGDGVLIWRAWALFKAKTWMMAIPCLLLLVSFVLSVYYSVEQTKSGGMPLDVSWLGAFFQTGYFVVLPLSFIMNLFTTSLIMWKLWTHHRYMRGLGFRNKISHAEKTILLLVESGFFYAILQLINVVLGFLPMETIPFYILFSIYYTFTGVYSSLIVILITEKQSMVDTFSFNSVSSISELPTTMDHGSQTATNLQTSRSV